MAMSYSYQSSNFTYGVLFSGLQKDIQEHAGITADFVSIRDTGIMTIITFSRSLTVSEKDILDTLISTHNPNSYPPPIEVGHIATMTDNKLPGTNGGTFTKGSWVTRDLNTVNGINVGSWISLTNNTFILLPGTYIIQASAPAHNVGGHSIRIYNVSESTVVLEGSNAVANNNKSSIMTQTISSITGTIVVTGSLQTFTLQHRCSNSYDTSGLGVANGYGGSEIYSIVSVTNIQKPS